MVGRGKALARGLCFWVVGDHGISNQRYFPFFRVGGREELVSLAGARTTMKCFLLLCESTFWWRNTVSVNLRCSLLIENLSKINSPKANIKSNLCERVLRKQILGHV